MPVCLQLCLRRDRERGRGRGGERERERVREGEFVSEREKGCVWVKRAKVELNGKRFWVPENKNVKKCKYSWTCLDVAFQRIINYYKFC